MMIPTTSTKLGSLWASSSQGRWLPPRMAVAEPNRSSLVIAKWTTMIHGVNAEGWAVPPFIILAAQYHLSNWYRECNVPANWRIATTDNGWTTNEVGLDWIKHFNHHTAPRTKGKYRLLIIDGHESHHSTKFEFYCQSYNIITLCTPPHSSHSSH